MSNLINQENNSIQQWKPINKNYITVYKEINDGKLKISNQIITIATSHEACIVEDINQLTSLIIKNGEITDKSECYKLIELFIIEVFEWFGKEISIALIQSLSKTVYQNYYWLRISELKLFVEKIKAGTWKQMHGMTPAVFMERLNDFCLESMNIRENKAREAQKLSPNFLTENGAIVANLLEVTYDKLNKTNIKYKGINLSSKEKKDNDFCIKWLKENNIEENLSIDWYSLFLKRKEIK